MIAGRSVPPARWTVSETSCELLEVDEGADELTLRFHADPRRALGSDHSVTFRTDREHGWGLLRPVLSSRAPPLKLSEWCQQAVVLDPASKDARVLRSSAGPIYRDRDACASAPNRSERICRGEDCRYEDPSAQPFVLPGCEPALAKLVHRAALLLRASHTASMRTLPKLDQMATQGGRVFQHVSIEGRCHPVSLRRIENGHVRFRMRYTTRDGVRVEDDAVFELEPLFHTATHVSQITAHYRADGSGSGGGTGANGSKVELYLGEDVFLLGGRLLFFQQASCEAEASP